MLATQLNALLTEGALKKNGIVRIRKYVVNDLNGKRIVVIVGLDVLNPDFGYVIGLFTLRDGVTGSLRCIYYYYHDYYYYDYYFSSSFSLDSIPCLPGNPVAMNEAIPLAAQAAPAALPGAIYITN